ncbi:MAG: hypothetical protein IKE28_01715 [Solobacterium sp.]|nr:hypothetical protein [Solobacterium sp.]
MRRLLYKIAVLGLLFSLAGCQKEKEPEPLPIEGTYKLTELVDSEGTDAGKLLANIQEEGEKVTMVLNDDGTGTLNIFDEPHSLTWTETEIVLEGQSLPMDWSPENLILHGGNEGTGRMVFQKES